MLRRVACLLTFFFLYASVARSQQAAEATRQPRILLLLDGSSSMLQPWSGSDIRFKAAARIVEGLMDSIYSVNPGVEFGLRVYGHQSPAQNNDCYDSRMEVMFSKNNITQMGLRLASLRPFGVSPIAYSLRQAAANDLVDDIHNAYSIILITDGGESCGGNICDVVTNLIERKIFFRPYIISLVDYAPLKDQYNCLGTYLQIAKPGDIGPAINQIVDAYRPVLSMPIITRRDTVAAPRMEQPRTVVVPALVIPPAPPRTAETTAVLRLAVLRPLLVRTLAGPVPRRLNVPQLPVFVAAPEPRQPQQPPADIRPGTPRTTVATTTPGQAPRPVRVPEPVIPPPAPRTAETIASLRNTALRTLAARAAAGAAPRSLSIPTLPIFVATPEPRQPRPVDTAPPAVVRRPPVDSPKRTSVVMRDLKPDSVKAVTGPKPKVVPPKPVEPVMTVSREDAPETRLSIYFTDGRGKFYSSSPQLRLIDAATNKQVKQFYRTVDPNGNPDPQVVTAGTYNLMVATRSNMLLKKIVIEEKKNNKIIVKVSNGSLRFRYDNNPSRPVNEFNAIVNIRFEDGPINQKQRCSEELEYAPGNYHVEINTLPVYQLNTDIDFGAITQIDIPEPGYLQFTNTTNIGPVQLFSPLGNQFMRFYGLRVTGNAEAQRVRLLPGVYEVHWMTKPNTPAAKREVMRFNIRSNTETAIELN